MIDALKGETLKTIRSLLLPLFALGWASPPSPGQAVDPYSGEPEWYKPGHPLEPADTAAIETLDGFSVEKVVSIPTNLGSIAAMTTDPDGNLIVAMQHQAGLYRLTPPEIGARGGSVLERMEGDAEKIGWAHGLLWAFDSLYVTVAEKNDAYRPGLYRLLDTDRDGVFDETKSLFEFQGAGEHGPHGLVVGPEGDSIYMICGNGTPRPDTIDRARTVSTSGEDHLIPPGFGDSQFTDAGWVFRFEPDGSNPELFASGLRNSYDLAFNRSGDLFTFDSDMEYDLGAPWYRPTRICHVVSGGEFGWRASASKWPEWYADSVHPVVNVGPSSPTGLVFGYDTAFPEKYRNALFALDWTYATLYAVHLEANGSSYKGEVERFASGIGLPLTDAVVCPDGALYVSVGGRRLGSAVYRIWYEGEESLVVSKPEKPSRNGASAIRRSLESLHGNADTGSLAKIWRRLGDSDRGIRYAARVALEWQPLDGWRQRAMKERNSLRRLTAFLALARQGGRDDLRLVLESIGDSRWEDWDEETLLLALRVVEIALARGGGELRTSDSFEFQSLRLLLPHTSSRVNRELARVLCYLGDASTIDPLLDLMEADKGDLSTGGLDLAGRNLKYASPLLSMAEAPPMVDRMHFAQCLNWIRDGWSIEQRRRYFQLVSEAIGSSRGGNGYVPFWQQTLDTARSNLSPDEIAALSNEWAGLEAEPALPEPEGPGRIWDLDYLVDRVGEGLEERDFENGKKMFAAANCIACHGMRGDGGLAGPDLTSLGQRFSVKDILDAIVNPSKAISDQYQTTLFTLVNGDVVSGRTLSKDSRNVVIVPNALKPAETRSISLDAISSIDPLPVSTMPPGLLNALNEEEVLDLVSYLLAGGDQGHPVFE